MIYFYDNAYFQKKAMRGVKLIINNYAILSRNYWRLGEHNPKQKEKASIPSEFPRDRLEMHEVAEATAGALSHLVLAAAGLAEVCHRRQLRVDGPPAEPAVVQVVHGLLGVLFATELSTISLLVEP